MDISFTIPSVKQKTFKRSEGEKIVMLEFHTQQNNNIHIRRRKKISDLYHQYILSEKAIQRSM